jgi:hypothetical protein
VDYPVVVLVQSKKHTITWAAEGVNDTFWIKFVLDPSTAKPGNPWDPNNKAFKVDHQGTKFDSLKAASPTYYWYAIYYQNPDANPGLTACKDFASDHDTGVNIKR